MENSNDKDIHTCNTERAKVDVYLDVPLCIRPFGSDKTFESVEEALDAFIQPEILDENNKYYCETCQQKCAAHKGLKFESFPYILSLQLKRFDFDYRTMSRFKIGSVVTFPQTLNVKKYLPDTAAQEHCDYELFSIMIHSGSASGG
ncbi:ubiquitin carboxyl-terminal hydrolase 64E isoform X1, partial [Brachionus plicatilis]